MLPEVGSTIVPPGFSRPSRSAASIIASPMRSLTDPPGFTNSSFARIVPGTSREIRSRRTIGVDPTRSSTVGYSRAIGRRLSGREARYAATSGVSPTTPSSSRRISASVATIAAIAHPNIVQNAHCDAARVRLREGRPGRGQVVEVADRDRRRHRDADRAADLLRRVQEPRGEPCLARLDAGESGDRDRDERERQREADEQVAGEADRRRTSRASGSACTRASRARRRRSPATSTGFDADLRHEPLREPREQARRFRRSRRTSRPSSRPSSAAPAARTA